MIKYLESLTHHTLTSVGGAQNDSSSSMQSEYGNGVSK